MNKFYETQLVEERKKNVQKITECLAEYTSDNNFLLLLMYEISQYLLIITGSNMHEITQLICSFVFQKRHEIFLSLIIELAKKYNFILKNELVDDSNLPDFMISNQKYLVVDKIKSRKLNYDSDKMTEVISFLLSEKILHEEFFWDVMRGSDSLVDCYLPSSMKWRQPIDGYERTGLKRFDLTFDEEKKDDVTKDS